MIASPRAFSLIKTFESCADKRPDGKYDAYPDPATGWKLPTIGWGTTGKGIIRGLVWTQEQCDAALNSHVQNVASAVSAALGFNKSNQNQFDALVSLAYNIGTTALINSTLFKLHKAKDYLGAARQFDVWNKAGGKVLQGLVNRRSAERKLYEMV